jgi:hypothetical protein
MKRKKIENSGISRYENKKLLKFTKIKANTGLSLAKFHTMFFRKATKLQEKLKTLGLQNSKT